VFESEDYGCGQTEKVAGRGAVDDGSSGTHLTEILELYYCFEFESDGKSLYSNYEIPSDAVITNEYDVTR